jgi:hypothetical protein
MKFKKILVTGAAVLVMGGSLAGGAFAAAHSKATRHENMSSVDTDSIQQGDQTGPDTAGTSDSASKVANLGKSREASTADTGNLQDGDQTGPDDSTVETSSESDGPGGHQDSSGNENHEFNGQE